MKTLLRWLLIGSIVYLYASNPVVTAMLSAVLVTVLVGQVVFVMLPGGSNDLFFNKAYIANMIAVVAVFTGYWGVKIVMVLSQVI